MTIDDNGQCRPSPPAHPPAWKCGHRATPRTWRSTLTSRRSSRMPVPGVGLQDRLVRADLLGGRAPRAGDVEGFMDPANAALLPRPRPATWGSSWPRPELRAVRRRHHQEPGPAPASGEHRLRAGRLAALDAAWAAATHC